MVSILGGSRTNARRNSQRLTAPTKTKFLQPWRLQSCAVICCYIFSHTYLHTGRSNYYTSNFLFKKICLKWETLQQIPFENTACSEAEKEKTQDSIMAPDSPLPPRAVLPPVPVPRVPPAEQQEPPQVQGPGAEGGRKGQKEGAQEAQAPPAQEQAGATEGEEEEEGKGSEEGGREKNA